MADITLFEATRQVRELLDQIDPDTGALSEEFGEVRALVEKKSVACVAYTIDTERQARYLLDAAAELQARARTLERRGEWLRRYIMEAMRAAGIDSIRDERGLFSAKLERDRDVAVELDPQATFPPELCLPPKPPSPSKAAIRRAIEQGQPVAGAHLVRRDRLTIR